VHDVGGAIPSSEEVVWTGAPVRVPTFQISDIPAVILGSFITVMALVAIAMVLIWSEGHSLGIIFALGVAPFLAIGTYLLIGRIVLRRIAMRNSSYVLTYRRLRVSTTVLGRTLVRAAWLSELPPPRLETGSDGVGTISFARGDHVFEIIGHRWMHFLNKRTIVLHGIADAAEVRDKIASMIPKW
jgi:hypothetical protein